MKIASILDLIISKIRSGNSDTRAVDAREVFNNIATSYINKDDSPQFVETISASGSLNNYIAAYSQPITAYAEGVVYKVSFPANTGPATININGLGQKAVKRANGEDLSANDLQGVVMLVYRNNVFQLIGGQSINENEFVKKTGDETIDGVKTFQEIPVLPDADPEADNEAVRKKYVDEVAESIREEIDNIPVEYIHTDQFTYAGQTIEIEGENYPYVELNHAPISILSAHIDHVYVYSDEYILSDQVLAFRFDNLIEGDVIEVVYTSNEDGSI